MTKQIKHIADDKHMTLNKVAAFVQDAMRSGADGDEVVGVTASMGGKIRALTLDIKPPAPGRVDTRGTGGVPAT